MFREKKEEIFHQHYPWFKCVFMYLAFDLGPINF